MSSLLLGKSHCFEPLLPCPIVTPYHISLLAIITLPCPKSTYQITLPCPKSTYHITMPCPINKYKITFQCLPLYLNHSVFILDMKYPNLANMNISVFHDHFHILLGYLYPEHPKALIIFLFFFSFTMSRI